MTVPWWEWLLIAIGGGLATGIILKVSFGLWGRLEKNRAQKKADRAALFDGLKEDLTRLETHLSEMRDKPPAHISIGCCLDYMKDTWVNKSGPNAKELLLGEKPNMPEKVKKRVDAVDTLYGEYQEALSAASLTCENKLAEIVFTRFDKNVPFPAKEFIPFLVIWTDALIKKGYEADEVIGWSMAEVFSQWYDMVNPMTGERNNPNLPGYSKMQMAMDIGEMVRQLEDDPRFTVQRERLCIAEKNLKRAVKSALASIK